MENGNPRTETATFGAGCFWQVEMAYRETEGVVETAVGYEDGTTEDPTYEQVCSGTTGHAEVTQVTFDPERVSYDELLDKFWEVHDPTRGEPMVGPLMTQKSGPGGSETRNSSHGRSCCQPQSSIPTSRRCLP